MRTSLKLRLFAAAISAAALAGDPIAWAQTPRPRPSAGSNPAAASNRQVQPRTPTAAREVVNLYTDAANFQNNAAYPLAVEAWRKFLTRFPDDPLASKAQHYLGVCYLQLERPNYDAAIAAFRAALADPQLEVREETLINLGWCLFYTAPQLEGEARSERLRSAAAVLEEYLNRYADGSYADKALYYLAETQYQLGQLRPATARFRQLTVDPRFAESSVMPDALYALGVAYEELEQPKLAAETYNRFLEKYSTHRLASDVRLRTAEFLLNDGQYREAAAMLGPIAGNKETPMRDYVLYRYAFALAKADRFDDSTKVYQLLQRDFPDSAYADKAALAAGQVLLQQKRYDEATVYLEQLLAGRDQIASEAAHWLSQIALAQNEPQRVVEIVRDALSWTSAGPLRTDLQVDLADALSQMPEGAAEANELYQAVALDNPDHAAAPRATYSVAFTALRNGQADEAAKWAEYFAKNFPEHALAAEATAIAAEAMLQTGKFAEAAKSYERLATANVDAPSASVWLMRAANGYFFAEDYAAAARLLEPMSDPSAGPQLRSEAFFLLGASKFKQDDHASAIDLLKKSIAIDPPFSGVDEAYLILAEAYVKAGEQELAKETFAKLIEKFPRSPYKTQAEFRLGQLSAATGEVEKAIAAYRGVLDPQTPGREEYADLLPYAAYNAARLLMGRSDWTAAEQLLTPLAGGEATAGEEIAAQAALSLAAVQRASNDDAAAVITLQRLLANEPDDAVEAQALLMQGQAYNALNQSDQAARSLSRLLAEHPDHPKLDEALYEAAWAFKRSDREDLATQTFRELAQRFAASPLVAEAHFHLGQRDFDSQQFEAAAVSYQAAVDAAEGEDAAVRRSSLYKLGWAYYKLDKFSQAAKFFGRLANEFADSDLRLDALFMQGECELKQGHYAAALGHYQAAAAELKSVGRRAVDPEIGQLVYLHGAQAAREIKDPAAIELAQRLEENYPQSPYLPQARFEKAFALADAKRTDQAISLFLEIAENQRNEIGARSRFMVGELRFGQRDLTAAVTAFQQVMYGYGSDQAPAAIRNWQARAAVEAGRCTELTIAELDGVKRQKAIELAIRFYQFVVDKHADHEMAVLAKNRIDELSRMLKT